MRHRLYLNGGSEGDTKEGDTPADPATVPKEEHDATVAELDALRTQTAELAAAIERDKAERAEAERKRREAEGDILPLYEDAKAKLTAAEQRAADAEARATALEKAETDRLAAIGAANVERIKALPEDLRSVIEALPEGMRADTVAEQVSRLEQVAAARDGKLAVGGRAGGGKPSPKAEIPAACRREAEKRKEDPQWYFEHVWTAKQAKKTA